MAARITADQMDPRNNLQYYTKAAVRNADVWTDKMVRQEYRRLRDIAQKRLKRLAVAEPGSLAYKSNVGRFGMTKSMSTDQLRQLLPDLAKFIAAKTGTVSGIREQRNKALATLHQHGYTGITKANLAAFGEFMDELRSSKAGRSIGSPTAVETFEFTQQHQIPWDKVKEDFADWLRDRKKLETYVKKQNARGKEVSSDDIIAEFDRLQTQREKRNQQARERRRKK